MAENIYLPRLGQTMTEGTIVKWLKNDGESIIKGDGLYTLEYDKAIIDVESTADGKLKILIAENETVPVGSVVGKLTGENENTELLEPETEPQTIKENTVPAETESTKTADSDEARIRISPMARRIAKEYGVDIAKVVASDPSGRISKEDIMKFHEEMQTKAQTSIVASGVQQASGQKPGEIKKIPLTGIRKVIAQRMVQSAFTAPTVTYSSDVDMSELAKLREQLNVELAKDNVKVSFTDLIIKAVAKALAASPNINVRLEGDNICFVPEINIGIAVAIEKGLIVPVIKNADKLTIEELSKVSKELAEKARSNSLKSDEITGGTFTISNLGMYGIDMFTPIINQPESAILGIGRMIEKPVVIGKNIEIRPMMVLSLTADHRVIDGAPAAQFLIEIKKYIERPYILMRE